MIWTAVRIWVRLRRGRQPPKDMPDEIWYFAYGSNANERLFGERRHMIWRDCRVAALENYRLCFTVAGGQWPGISAPANIVSATGEMVYGVLYLLPLRKFARLDASEGWQYDYLWIDVEDKDANRIEAVTFQVPPGQPEGQPGREYLDIIREAARQRKYHEDYIAFLDRIEARE